MHTPPEIWDSIRVIQLARRLGITKNAVYKWQKKGKIPAERVLEIEALYPDLKPYRLRPDLWPAPESDQIASG